MAIVELFYIIESINIAESPAKFITDRYIQILQR